MWERGGMIRRWSGLVVLLLAGCQGNNSPICEIEGVLKYQGTPIPGVQLSFEPDDPGTKSVSIGITDDNGRFVMYIGGTPGAFKGKVRVRCDDPLAATGQKTPVPEEIETRYRALCQKYGADKSTYELTIEQTNKNLVLDLE